LAQRIATLISPVLVDPKSDTEEEVFDVEALAAYLKVEPSWIYKSLDKIPHVKLGKYLRFKRRAIDSWMDRESTRPTAALRMKQR
jgi:excisionase family DNA binding protein